MGFNAGAGRSRTFLEGGVRLVLDPVEAKTSKIGKAARIPGIGIFNIRAIPMPTILTLPLFCVKYKKSKHLDKLCIILKDA